MLEAAIGFVSAVRMGEPSCSPAQARVRENPLSVGRQIILRIPTQHFDTMIFFLNK